MEELARYDGKFAETAQQLASARAVVEDVGATVRDYAEGIQASPERLAEIEDRLALLDRLKRKYGATLAEVIAYGEEVAAKLAEIENRDEILKDLRAELARAAEAYRVAAGALRRERAAAAKQAGEAGREADQRPGDEGEVRGCGERAAGRGGVDGAWLGRGGMPDCDQCGRAVEAAG